MNLTVKILCSLLLCFLCSSAFAQCRVVDPEAKDWIENNREKIAKMTRREWLELNEGYKWIVFTELSSKQQHDFFQKK